MGYRVKGTLKLPDGSPASNAEIEFISRKNFSPLVQELKSNILCGPDGAYDVTLEYGEYAVLVYPGGTYPAALGTIILATDAAVGQDLPTLLQQAGWQPATPEYIQQIATWLAEANASATSSAASASAAKVSETNAKDSENAALSSENSAASSASAATTKATEAASFASAALASKNASATSEANSLSSKDAAAASASTAVAAADTATQKALAAAGSEAVSLDAATRAENAALSMVGAIIDGGECDLSGGVYPQPISASGITYSTVWFVAVGGLVSGITYDVGDQLRYTTANSGYYFRVDAKDEVYSVNGEKGAVTVSPEKIGAEKTGVAQTLVDQHASKTGAHGISGVQGLTEALAGKETAGAAASAITAHEAKGGAHAIEGVAGLRGELDAIKAAGGDAVLDVKWLTKRSPMRTGYTAGDGQTLSRSLYPDAVAAIQAGLVPVCTDAEWLADPAKRGCFTLGDGSTTFRLPDLNGAQPGSYGPVYLGGGTTDGGTILRDRIQNITGELNGIYGEIAHTSASSKGAFSPNLTAVEGRSGWKPGIGTAWDTRSLATFDASRVARTGDTTRPITAEGCLAIKLFGAVQNAGSADAAALATAVADLAARVSLLEQRKSTCLVNATGTGAPHETVVSQLPANVVINTRYVLPNPFGNNTPVTCWAEIFLNDKWADAGFIFSSGGWGVKATYVQGEGIVVQTGSSRVWAISAESGAGHGPAVPVTSAPCRVFVRKLEA